MTGGAGVACIVEAGASGIIWKIGASKVIEIEEESGKVNMLLAGTSSIVGGAGMSSVVVGVCRADKTCTIGTDASRMVRDRKAGASGIVEG
jgi:hypothetical protein